MITNDSAANWQKEKTLIRQLFSNRFSGVILIDCKSKRILKFSDDFLGTFSKLVRFDETPYDVQFSAILKENKLFIGAPQFEKSISYHTIVEELSEKESYSTNFSFTNADGERKFFKLTYQYFDEKKEQILMFAENVSDVMVAEIDALTGGYNMIGFKRRVKQWFEKNPNKKFRVHRYDLDNFRDVNGVYGQKIGDKLIKDIANYMKLYDSENSFSAHLNADHFIRFCGSDDLSVEECYNNFIDCFSTYHLSIPITMHMGVYDLNEENRDIEVISYKALLALKDIKGDMNRRIAYYEAGMMQREQEKLELLNSVDEAIKNKEFEIWFQPQINYNDKKVFGAEALTRWRHPEKGLLPPDDFIPLLEKSNLISKVDLYVIETVCGYVRKWTDIIGEDKLQISVNLSKIDILNQNFINTALDTIKKYGLKPSYIHFEITESTYSFDVDKIIEEVGKLRKKGFLIELDDFGAGYSSLNTLKDIDVDKLKLDMKFLEGNKSDDKDKIIISAIINMANTLGLTVIAEGVETKEQAEMLNSFGCNEMQGFYYSRSLPADEYEKLITNEAELLNLN